MRKISIFMVAIFLAFLVVVPAAHAVEISKTIVLDDVECLTQGETGKDGDDVFIRYEADSDIGVREERIPVGNGSGKSDMDVGDIWSVNKPITFKNYLYVNLRDVDTGKNDSLGATSYFTDDSQADIEERYFNERTGRYVLHAHWQ